MCIVLFFPRSIDEGVSTESKLQIMEGIECGQVNTTPFAEESKNCTQDDGTSKSNSEVLGHEIQVRSLCVCVCVCVCKVVPVL
jgi:hypothetical protein